MSTTFTFDEWFCVALARTIRNGETTFHGFSSPCATIAMHVAKRTHAPEMVLIEGATYAVDPHPRFVTPTSNDWALMTEAATVLRFEELFDMGARGEETIIADPRGHAAAGGAGIHGDVLADNVALADDEGGILALVFEILRLVPYRGEGEDARTLANARAPGDDDVRDQFDPVADLRLGADDAIRANAGAGGDRRARLDDSGGMNVRHRPLDPVHVSRP